MIEFKGIKVYCLSIRHMEQEIYNVVREKVSVERKLKAESFRFKNDSYRSVCAELLLRYALIENGMDTEKIEFSYNSHGKPFFSNQSMKQIHFNMSHSGDWVVLGISREEVGIDIEKIRAGLEGTVDMLYTDYEKTYIYNAFDSERDYRLIQIWTMKESYSKFLGSGLFAGLENFEVNVMEGSVTDCGGKVSGVKITCLPWEKGYCLAVCGRESLAELKTIEIEEILKEFKRL